MENACSKTTTGEATVAITSDPHMKAKMTTPSVHTNGGTCMRYPSEESISQQKHIQATQSYLRHFTTAVVVRILLVSEQMFVIKDDPCYTNAQSHTPDRPNNRYLIWISCRNVCVRLHQFSPHMKLRRAWLHPVISLNLHGGGMLCMYAGGLCVLSDLA